MHRWVVGGPHDDWRAEISYDYLSNKRVFRVWYKREVFADLDAAFVDRHEIADFPSILRPFIEAYKAL